MAGYLTAGAGLSAACSLLAIWLLGRAKSPDQANMAAALLVAGLCGVTVSLLGLWLS